MRIWIKSNSGKVEEIYANLKDNFGLGGSTNISLTDKNDLVIESSVFKEIQSKYQNMLNYIAKTIIT